MKKHANSKKSSILSIMATVLVLSLVVFSAPASAVQLNMAVNNTSTPAGGIVGFDLGLDIASGERVPFSTVTLAITGPQSKTCTFALDGTPTGGDCSGIQIFRTNNHADYRQDFGYGYGYDGTSSYGTDFGYGYGYGYSTTPGDEFFWRVEWDTTGMAPGTYTATYYATAGSRTFNLENAQTFDITAVTSATIDLRTELGYPQGNDFSFRCVTPGMTPEAYDWEITHVETGTREYLQYDITEQAVFHSMRRTGDYLVSCTATQGSTTLIDTLTVTNTATPPAEQQPGNYAPTVIIGNNTVVTVPANANQDVEITIPVGVVQTQIDLSALLLNVPSGASAFMPVSAIFNATASAGVHVTVPAGITITSTNAWNGVLTLPQITTNTASLPSGATVGAVIEVGSNVPLTFDKGVRILFTGRAGENAAYVSNGVTNTITSTCSADTQAAADALPAASDCKIDVGSDLVVWTKHFTTFVTYTAPASSSSSGRSVYTGYYRAPQETVAEEPASEEQQPEPQQQPVQQTTPNTATPAEEPTEAPAITGLVTGDDGTSTVPSWVKLAGILALIGVAAVSVIVRLKRK